MSSLTSGINNIYTITSQISKLKSKSEESALNLDSFQLASEQNFNQMLSDLLSSTDENEEDKDEKKFDPFSLMGEYSQNILSAQTGQGTTETSTDINPSIFDLSRPSYLNSLAELQKNPLALQAYLFNQSNSI